MLMFGKILATALLVLGLSLWVVSVLPPLPDAPSLAEVPGALVAASLSAEEEETIVTLEGTVVLSDDLRPVPYLAYAQEDGSMATRQLILAGKRGCSPIAGDLPCADVRGNNYPDLAHGEQVRVRGVVRGDQVFVSSLDRL